MVLCRPCCRASLRMVDMMTGFGQTAEFGVRKYLYINLQITAVETV